MHVVDREGENFLDINDNDVDDQKAGKKLMNALIRENFQRNFILNGLIQANDEDWVIISDLDEIPNLDMNDLKQCKNEIVFFKQTMIYYKLNLFLEDFPWIGLVPSSSFARIFDLNSFSHSPLAATFPEPIATVIRHHNFALYFLTYKVNINIL